MIQFEQVGKRYPNGHQGLEGVSFHIRRGEMVFITGHSGAGKSTLLKLIMCMERPSSGQVHVGGQNLRDLGSDDIPYLRRQIGVVFQNHQLLFDRTVFDNVALPLVINGTPADEVGRRVRAALDKVGLLSKEKSYPIALSGGEQQRVGIARAVAVSPGTLLMDEPFGALDAITRGRLQEELRELHQRLGQTIVFVTHDIDEAALLADRIAVMRDGRVLQYDTPLNIIMRPADHFVAELVGANDILRRLSLVSVAAAMVELGPGAAIDPDEPAIELPSRLRAGLSMLLDSSAPRVIVRDRGRPVGYLDLAAIQAASVPQVAGAAS